MPTFVLLVLIGCGADQRSTSAFDVAPPPGAGGITLTAPSSHVSGDTVDLSVTATDLQPGDRVDFGFGTTTGAGSCPFRAQTGGSPCLDITGHVESLGTATATNDSGAVVARLSVPWSAPWDTAYVQAFLLRGSQSATSQVAAVDVVQPWEDHAPRLVALEAAVAALQSDVAGIDDDVGLILADYVTHDELDAAVSGSSGATRPTNPTVGAVWVSPGGDVEVFNGLGWSTIVSNPICGDGYAVSGEACDDGNTSNNDACTNVCELADCGDGFVQPGEGCDDGNSVNTDTCTNACTVQVVPTSFVMFVTSQAFNGALGGLAGADTRCQTAAQTGGRTGTFRAFLSAAGVNAKDRIVNGEFRRVDGTLIASNLTQLAGADLTASVLKTELGTNTPTDTFDTWTGSNATGSWFGSANDDCNAWTTSSGNGITGGSQQTAYVLWKAWNREACGNARRLYCVQVP